MLTFSLCLHVPSVHICDGIQQRAVIHLMNIHHCSVIGVAQLAAPQTGMDDGIMAASSGIGCHTAFVSLSFRYAVLSLTLMYVWMCVYIVCTCTHTYI